MEDKGCLRGRIRDTHTETETERQRNRADCDGKDVHMSHLVAVDEIIIGAESMKGGL